MSITTNTFYDKYKLSVIADIQKVEREIQTAKKSLMYLRDKIGECDECKNLMKGIDDDAIKYREIKPHSELHKLYLKSYHKTLRQLRIAEHELNKLEKLKKINLKAYRRYIKAINFEISKVILTNGSFNFGLHISEMNVVFKPRYVGKKYNNKVVDWHASTTQLVNIAEYTSDDTRKIADDFKARNITRQTFIELMKPYVYSEEDTSKPKWIMFYTDDGNAWWHWKKTDCILPNKTLYSFEPTRFTNLVVDGARSKHKVSETLTINEILNETRLGNVDKIQCIRRIDPLYFTNTL